MAQKTTALSKFKKFLKMNIPPTWAKHFAYQVLSFLVSVALIVAVANYATIKSYDERELKFVDGFTVTAHTGAYNTADNTLNSVQAAIDNNVDIFEIDVRLRPDGTPVMAHDIVVSNSDGVELASAFKMLRETQIGINLDVKETKALKPLYNLIIQYSLMDRAFLTGIETNQVNAVRENCPNVDYYINYVPSRIRIFDEDYRSKILKILKSSGAVGINCKYIYASQTLANLLHDNGYKLSLWTVDTERQMKRALVVKADNITTHNPDLLNDVIDNWGK